MLADASDEPNEGILPGWRELVAVTRYRLVAAAGETQDFSPKSLKKRRGFGKPCGLRRLIFAGRFSINSCYETRASAKSEKRFGGGGVTPVKLAPNYRAALAA